ncbi:MAG: hypothetical protein HYS12_18560 [Planctomycetes bacterium]|nr:hypothetical protein [Planctomycetota bacterium]
MRRWLLLVALGAALTLAMLRVGCPPVPNDAPAPRDEQAQNDKPHALPPGARERLEALKRYHSRGSSSPASREWEYVRAAAFLADGRSAVAMTSRNSLVVFDLETGDRVRRFTDWQSGEPDGEPVVLPGGHLVQVSCNDGRFLVWERFFEGGGPGLVRALSADRGRLVAAVPVGGGAQTLQVSDTQAGRLLRTFGPFPEGVIATALSPDGRLLLSIAAPGRDDPGNEIPLCVWDVETGKLVRHLSGHADGVYKLRFAQDGRRVLSARHDGTVRVWDVVSGRELRCLGTITTRRNGPRIRDAVFVSGDRYVLAGGDFTDVILWEVASGKPVLRFDPQPRRGVGPFESVAVSADGTRALTATQGIFRLWDLRTGALVRELDGRRRFDPEVNCLAFLPDGKRLLSGSDVDLVLWDVQTRRAERYLPATTRALALAPDGKRALSTTKGELRLWDLATGKTIKILQDLEQGGFRVRLAPGNKVVTFGGWNGRSGTVQVWDLVKGQIERTFEFEGFPLLSADGMRLVTSTRDDAPSFVVWDVASGRRVRIFPGRRVGIGGLSPDGRYLLASERGWVEGKWAEGNSLEILHVWDLETGRLVRKFDPVRGWVTAAAFSPDSKWLAASDDETFSVRLWEVATGRQVRRFIRTTLATRIKAIAFSPDGKLLATGGEDLTLKLWNIGTGREVGPFVADEE